LPRSRTQDNSFHNLCLCIPSANQNKGGLTPYEWIGTTHPDAWHEFTTWVENGRFGGFKKRNFLLKDLNAKVEERFCERNLNDTRYACRLAMQEMRDMYAQCPQKYGLTIPKYYNDGITEIRRVFARPGSITAYLRRSWGLQSLKTDAEGRRLGDRHHALDAFIVAACSESMLQRATKLFQQTEERKTNAADAPPSPISRNDMSKLLNTIFVSRAEINKQTGQLHEETLRSIREEKEDKSDRKVKIVYERKYIEKLTAKDIEKIKDAARCPALVEALREWIAKDKPKDDLPYIEHAEGDAHLRKDYIRRVRVRRGPFTSGIELKRGAGTAQADNGDMVRTDVYSKKSKYYLVPVYAWHIATGEKPDKVVKAGGSEKWLPLDESYVFLFSLYPYNYVLTENGKGEIKEGYFRGTNIATASITLSPHDDSSKDALIQSIGIQNMKRFEKYRADRLGNLHRPTGEHQL
jgi:CRISPR-associated endonuclease Csn1